MKIFIALAIVLRTFGLRELGRYKFFRYVGGLIYDDSGNDFHGRNGNNILEDSNDGVFTDRGIYLDGTSSYFLVHSDEFGQVPVFDPEWSFSMWIFLLSGGPILHRISDQANTSFKIVFTSTGAYVEFNNCTSTCSLNNFNLSFSYPLNTWLVLSMDILSGDYIEFIENNTPLVTHTTGMQYGDNDSHSFTYIGTDSATFLNAFVYSLRINLGDPNYSSMFTSDNSLCEGYCYFNSSPEPQCTCSNCNPRSGSYYCLSQCDDYTLASDCSTDASSCSGIYHLTSGCHECPKDKWPVCDSETSEDLSSLLCHSSCRGCKGPTSSDCLACPTNYMNLNSGTCECPLNSTVVGSECVCNSPYIMSTSGSSHSCVLCSWPCLECSGVNTFCTSCVQTSANLNTSSGECSCPSNSSSNASSCECDTGFVLQVVENTFECSSCLFPCLGCSGTPDACTSCESSFNLSGTFCVCPSNSTLVSNQCECPSGFFLSSVSDSQTEFGCVQCSESCLKCSESPSTCTECSFAFSILRNGSCVCPENSSLVLQQCVCDDGFEMKNSECVKSTDEMVLNIFDSLESFFISLIAAIVFVSTLLITDPCSVWIILNNIQILSYLPLHAFDLPPKLETICNAFKLSSILPNLSLILFGEDLRTQGLPHRWVEKEVERTHFFLNIGQVLLILLVCVCYLLIIAILTCVSKDKFGKYLKEFRYNFVLRLWVEVFLEVFFASLISWNLVLEGNLDYENIVGGGVFLIQISSIFLLWKKLHSIVKHPEETPEIIKNRYCCLFYEFDEERSTDSYGYYIYFMMRRAGYLLGLFYLSSFRLLQLILSLNYSVMQIYIQIGYAKFKDKLNQKVSIIIEVLFGLIFVLILYFNCDISERERTFIDYWTLGVLGLMVGILLINHLIKILSNCSDRCRRGRNAVIDESAVVANFNREDSVIFSRPFNMRKVNCEESLNAEDMS